MKQSFFKLHNIFLMSMAIGMLVIGFILLGQGPVNGIKSLTVAPIILTFAYVVMVPFAILFSKKGTETKGD